MRVVDVGVADVEDARQIVMGIIDDMDLHAADATVGLGPIAQFSQRDGGGIDQPDEVAAVASALTVEKLGDLFERIGEDGDRPTLVGVAEGRMRKRAAGEVIMVLGTGVPAGLQRPKAVEVAQLREDQRHQMIPAEERLVVGVPVVPCDDRREPPPVDRFQEFGENGRSEAHVPPSTF